VKKRSSSLEAAEKFQVFKVNSLEYDNYFYMRELNNNKIKNISVIGSLVIFLYFIVIYFLFFLNINYGSYVFMHKFLSIIIINNLNIIFALDSLSIIFLLLTTLLFPLIFITLKRLSCLYNNDTIILNFKELSLFIFIIEFFLLLTFTSVNFF
jgi:hypothetical protein